MSIRHLFVCGISAVLSLGLISCNKENRSTATTAFHLPSLELKTSGQSLAAEGLTTKITRADIQDAFVFKEGSLARTLQFETRCQRGSKIWTAEISMSYTRKIPLVAVLPEDLLRPLTLQSEAPTHCRFRIIGRTPDGSQNILDVPELRIVDVQKDDGIKSQSMSSTPIDEQTITEDTLDQFLFVAPQRDRWTATLLCEDFSISKPTGGQDNIVFDSHDLLKAGSKILTRFHQPCRVVFSKDGRRQLISRNFAINIQHANLDIQVKLAAGLTSGNLPNRINGARSLPILQLEITNPSGVSRRLQLSKKDLNQISAFVKPHSLACKNIKLSFQKLNAQPQEALLAADEGNYDVHIAAGASVLLTVIASVPTGDPAPIWSLSVSSDVTWNIPLLAESDPHTQIDTLVLPIHGQLKLGNFECAALTLPPIH